MGRLYIWGLLVPAAALLAFPGLDRSIAGWFASEDGFALAGIAPARLIYHTVKIVALVLFAIVCTAVGWCLSGDRDFYGLPKRGATYLLIVAVVAPLLLANYTLKKTWGRPRPREVREFGGPYEFAAITEPRPHRDESSFVSGHAAVGFFPLALCPLLACPMRRRRTAITALIAGYFIGFCRLVEGGHWPSDIVFSGVLTLGVSYGVYRLMFGKAEPTLQTIPLPPSVGAASICAQLRNFLL